MIERLKQFLDAYVDSPAPGDSDETANHRLAVAATALMLQVAQVDKQEDQQEIDLILKLAGDVHQLTDQEEKELLAIARERTVDSTSLYEFTSVINERCVHEERLKLVESLWQVALADHQIHKYEEHLIRRVSDLLYLTPAEFMRCRHRAEKRQPTNPDQG